MTVLCLSLIGAGELFRVMKVREDKWNLLEITGYAGVVIFYLSLLLHDPMYQMLALILDPRASDGGIRIYLSEIQRQSGDAGVLCDCLCPA